MKPSVLQQRNGIQLSYDLNSPVYDTHIYPRQSSNGSTVILYGHDSGLRVVWYAGKKFKAPVTASAKVNGSAKQDAMVIDLSDDDEPAQSQSIPTKAEFEEEEEEIDPAHPYHEVLRHLDIPLGSPSLRLATPNLQPDLSDTTAYPGLLQDHAVIAIACADLSIRLVVLPLQPPAPGVSDPSKVGVQIVRLLGPGFHQDLVSGLALTYTGVSDDAADEADGQAQKWSFLVASTSCTGTGLLLVHQIPINGTRLSTENDELAPIRRQYLRLSLIGLKLAFNTSPHPAERHSNLLITIPDASCVKIYQVFRHSLNRNRRGSVGTTDSASSTRSTSRPSADSGKFLITLQPEFIASNAEEPNQRRKRVLDSTWILGGTAILVLLHGGEWGVWDLEAAGPVSTTSNQNLIKGQGSISGISGGCGAKFAVKGRVPTAISTSTTEKSQPATSTGLVPATPHTRRLQAQGLFAESQEPAAAPKSAQAGSINITTTKDNRNDETVIMTYGDQRMYIPSMLSHWKSEVAAKAAFAVVSGTSSILPSLRTGGEDVRRVLLLPQFSKQEDPSFGAKALPNFLASTATRLLLFTTPLFDSSNNGEASTELTRPLPLTFSNADQSLLQQGALDVDGMDRILEGMNSPAQSRRLPTQTSKAKPNFGKSVNISRDVDMDATPDMPSPTTSKRLQSSSKKDTGRRLFS